MSESRVLEAALYAGLALLLVSELVDVLGVTRRRAVRHLTEAWSRVEVQARREARRSEMALIASQIGRRR